MQFKYPEILYALLLLLIPIFIHLFQLRRFEKVAFTNVAFLKKVVLQTRKSSRLKKFLILLTRLGLFTALIIAFAQPYLSKNKQSLKPKTVLYLDNSLSMQAKNGTSELFKKAIQDIITNYKEVAELTILTNDDSYVNLNDKDLKNQLLSLEYSPYSKNIKTVLLQADKQFKQVKGIKNHLILVSDFQASNVKDNLPINKEVQYSFVQLKPQITQNISIDSVYIAKQNGLNIDLNVVLKSYNNNTENLSVSLFKEKILVGKTACSLEENQTNTVTFQIPFNDSFNGRIVINDNFIPFDNELFFSLNKVEKINVLAIGDQNEFLSKIYTSAEFNLISNKINQVDYNKIANQHLIVLNELETIPLSLQKSISQFVVNGGSLVIIPSLKTNITNYNNLFSALKIGAISKKEKSEHQVNSINFSHSILDNVFEKKIKNFQYPNVKSIFNTTLKNKSSILKFENQQAFISEIKSNKGKVYWIAAAINQLNSNFKSSPLIVPVFYNFGKQSYQLTALYYTLGNKNTVDVKTTILNDEVLTIQGIDSNNNSNFIPLQQVSQQKVVLQIEENPKKAGFYQIIKQEKPLKNIAFNYNRIEGATIYSDMKSMVKPYDNVSYSTNIKQTFEGISTAYSVKSYWKYFIALALLFLIIELLLIKFLKN
jgi:hypothetical protein